MRCPNLSDLPDPPPGRFGWPWTVAYPRSHPECTNGLEWPRISVVTPSYNQGDFIEETIRSVLLQGYPDLEYVIMDGNSSDDSVRIIKKYEPWLSYWSSQTDGGQSDAVNQGFSHSSGILGNWLNSDDCLLPGALFEVAKAYQRRPGAVLFIANSEYRSEDGAHVVWPVVRFPMNANELTEYFEGLYVPQPSAFFNLSAFKAAGCLNNDLHYAMDLDLWFRLVAAGEVERIDSQVSWMRAHPDAKTFSAGLRVTNEVHSVIRKYAKIKHYARVDQGAARRRFEVRLSLIEKEILAGRWYTALPHLVITAVQNPYQIASRGAKFLAQKLKKH